MQGNMKPESYSNLNKKLNTKRVFLEDEKSFKGKRFAVKESNILKKAEGSDDCYAAKCMIHFGDNFQLKCVKDTPIYTN